MTLRVGSGPLHVVPDVVGQFRAAALQALRAAGFATTVVFDGATGAEAAPGTVVRQEPAGGTSGQGTVTVVVHGSDVTVTVPGVGGLTLSAAQNALGAVGLGCDAPAALPAGRSSDRPGRGRRPRDRRDRPPRARAPAHADDLTVGRHAAPRSAAQATPR